MKLPELKEKLKSKYIVRVVAGVLTIALVGTGIGATAVFFCREEQHRSHSRGRQHNRKQQGC